MCNNSDQVVLLQQRFGNSIWECRRCSLQFLWPQPFDDRLKIIYEEVYFETWGIKNQETMVKELKKKTFRSRFKLIEKELKQGDHILDCGCATGYLLEVAQEKGYIPFGVDLSEFAAKEAIKKFGGNRIYLGQLEEARFLDNPEKKFSAVFLMDYIEHVRNPGKVLKLVAAMLNEHGNVVISTPKMNSLTHLVMQNGWSHYKEEHLFYFTFKAIKALLQVCGFTDIQEHTAIKYLSFNYIHGHFTTYPHVFFTPVIRLIWKVLPTSVCNWTFPIQLGDMVVTAKKGRPEKKLVE
jgi:2-polyprenyl-3-methyl-5-hydroxy-6-metoxy-1,4-benzoquinol methylase